MKTVFASALASTMLLSAGAAYAQDAEPPASPFSVSINAGLFSDYRFRGVSLNQENIALQGGIDFEYALSDTVSLYAGNWNSTLEKNTGYGNYEIDLYGGVKGTMGAVGWKLGIMSYLYPDQAANVDYYEIQAEVSGTAGPVALTLGTFIAPSQSNYGDDTGVYVYSSAGYSIPNMPISLKATLGYEDNAFIDDKLDWSLGVAYTYSVFTIGVAYVDTNVSVPYVRSGDLRDAADATAVVSLGVVF